MIVPAKPKVVQKKRPTLRIRKITSKTIWPSAEGSLTVKEMSFGHLVNALAWTERYMHKCPEELHQWQRVMIVELYRRGGHEAAYCMGVNQW